MMASNYARASDLSPKGKVLNHTMGQRRLVVIAPPLSAPRSLSQQQQKQGAPKESMYEKYFRKDLITFFGCGQLLCGTLTIIGHALIFAKHIKKLDGLDDDVYGKGRYGHGSYYYHDNGRHEYGKPQEIRAYGISKFLRIGYYLDNMGGGIWCGIFFLLAGLFGLAAARRQKQCYIITSMVITIFC